MLLNAFNLNQIQTTLAIVEQAVADRLDINGLRSALRSVVTKEGATRAPSMREAKKHRLPRCPDCGAPMVPVATGGENIKVMGCRKCRYSEVVK